MNILRARNELHQMTNNNPESQLSHSVDPNFLFNSLHLLNPQKHPRNSKILFAHHAHSHLYKDETTKNIQKNATTKQKVEVKTPIFKNKKGEDFSSSQKQRFEKLGLENFIKQEPIEQKLVQRHHEPIEQKIIKNLNNTYFRSTEHIHGKRKNMVNTLGIKRSSMSNYKVDWDEKNIDELEIEWKDIGFIPNKVFPCRKNNSVKNKIYTPKKQQESQKKLFNQKMIHKEENSIEKINSMNFLQSKDFDDFNSLLNLHQKVNSLQSSRILNKDRKLLTNASKELNKSQEFMKKSEISKILTIDRSLSTRKHQKRPWTSKESVLKNRKISEQINLIDNSPRKRRYSETTRKSFKSFRESPKNGKNFAGKLPDVEQGSDFIKGKRMNIYQAPESRVIDLF